MNRIDKQFVEQKSTRPRLSLFLASLVGVFSGYFLTSHLPYLVSAITCAVLIVFSATASTRLAHPTVWWSSLGTIAGCIAGTSVAVNAAFSQLGLDSKELWRHTVVTSLSIGGFISGIVLGRNLDRAFNLPRPKDFLKAASGLTAVIFALLVSIEFTKNGIEEARALSSRLSTVTTVLVTALLLPGWIGFQICRLFETRGKFKRQER